MVYARCQLQPPQRHEQPIATIAATKKTDQSIVTVRPEYYVGSTGSVYGHQII